jgi:hypothetical protein
MTTVTGDLIEDQTRRAILSGKVSVNPAQAEEIEDLETVTVTIDGNGVQPGSYKGEVRIYYKEQAASSPLPIPIEATFESVPDVSVDASSVNQTLFAERSCRDIPYVGTVDPRADPVLATLPIYLVQKASDDARVEGAEVLAVTGPDGLVLPSGTVRVSTPLPLTLTPQGAKPLDLVVSGYNMPAGDYSGSLRVHVAKQSTAIDVPFKVKVRDGWLYPLLVLLASFIIGVLVQWYNETAVSARQLVRDINRCRNHLKKNSGHLQMAEKSKAGGLIALAMDAAQNQNTRPKAKKHIEAFDDLVKEQEEKIKELLSEIETLKKGIKGLHVTFLNKVRDKLSDGISELEMEVEGGRTPSLDEARHRFDGLIADIETMKKLESVLQGVPEELRQQLKMDTAENVDDIVKALSEALLKSIDDLDSRVKNVEIGLCVREDIQHRLAQAKRELGSSDMTKLQEWASSIPEIEKQVQRLEKLFRSWSEKRAGLGPDTLGRLNEAKSVEQMEVIFEQERRPEAPVRSPVSGEFDAFGEAAWAGLDYGVMSASRSLLGSLALLVDIVDEGRVQAQPGKAEQSWTAYTFRLKFGVIAVQLLVYLFALLVGWATLYLGNDTFGARLEDYIALFLWGATINIISGQQIKIESILQHKAQKIAENEEQTP